MEKLKSILMSRTVRLAIAQSIVGIALMIATEYDAPAVILIIKSIGDILLRMDTTRAI